MIMKPIIWAGAAVLLFPAFISDSSTAFSNSVSSVLVFAGLFFLLRTAESKRLSKRMRGFSHALGLILALMTACGAALDSLGAVPYTSLLFIAAIAVYTHVYGQGIALLWSFLEGSESRLSASCGVPSGGAWSLLDRILKSRWLLPFLMLLCWTPCYLSSFPGNFMYDASYEYYQLTDGFTRSYPLLHSAIATRLLYASEQLTGSVNPGIAVYVITQMLLMAALFSHIIRKLYALRVHPAVVGVLALYYAAFPVIHLLVTCTTRDVLFSTLVTLVVYLFFLLARDPDEFMSSARKVFGLAAALVFMLLSRNNNSGPLAMLLLLAACILICAFFGRKHVRHSLLFTASALVLFYGVNAVLVALCQPLYDSPPSSSMAMLTQPIARAYVLHGDTWPEEDKAAFESFFNMVTFEYVPQNADPSKGNLQVRYANMKEFLAFWIKIGLRHPGCYLDAVLATTKQLWYPGSILDGYNVRGMYPGYDKCYFYFGRYIEEIGSRMNWLPGVFSFYEQIGLMISFEKIPVVSMLFSIGFHLWLLLNCLFYAAYRKCRSLFWPLGIALVYVICSSFVPLVLLRYFAVLFLIFPLTAAFTLTPSTLAARRPCEKP